MYKTEQERFWAGEFGDEYIARNAGTTRLASSISLLSKALARTHGVRSVLELGANIGLNMLALRQLLPEAQLHAVEINARAYEQLSGIEGVTAHHASLLDFKQPEPVDFAFTRGVLIHLAPEELSGAYRTLYESSARYIGLMEYYNPTPVEVPYRGHTGKLFKRNWCADFMRQYPDVRLLDYGFIFHMDPLFPADDVTWFMLEKHHSRSIAM